MRAISWQFEMSIPDSPRLHGMQESSFQKRIVMVQAMPYPNITDNKQDCLEYVAVLQDRLLEMGVLTTKNVVRLRRKKAKLPLTIFCDSLIQERIKKLGMQEPCALCPQSFPALFWQEVYDDLGIKVEVPLVPRLTEEQHTSLEYYLFLPIYIPGITEEQYPEDFVKPAWGEYLTVSSIERKPLEGQWVAVETITKPNWDDRVGYPDDRLMAAVKRTTRFNTSHDQLTGGILAEIAKATGFPKKSTRLPTAEEWNLIGNLFNWLREHRSMNLPDLGSTCSWEWCANAYDSEYRLGVGGSEGGGLADVHGYWHGDSDDSLGFRVLAVL